MRDLIVSTISSRMEEMIDFASRLIAVPTENPPGQQYHACVEVISKELRRIGLGCEVLDVPSKGVREPLQYVRSFRGTGQHKLYFHGHYDVVPASVE
jgi:acetylornithine deacetylase/succinyl-diaminopimelate desuccinylase-like protein